MSTANEKLASSLEQLARVQQEGRVLRSASLSRVHRERLMNNGFLQQAAKGWLFVSNPAETPDDPTGWYGCFWEFCARRCEHRFGDAWHISAEGSILRHAGIEAIPQQVIVCSPTAANKSIALPHDTSILDIRPRSGIDPVDVVVGEGGIRLLKAEAALVRIADRFFESQGVAVKTVLSQIHDSRDLLQRLLGGAHTVVAGRLAGALRAIGRADTADDLLDVMRSAGHRVRETAPFEHTASVGLSRPMMQPAAARLGVMWEHYRETVASIMPDAAGPPQDAEAYMADVDERYQTDAYHSLSIEGYRVSPHLISRVRTGVWNPAAVQSDASARDAMAARGYWQAFQLVRDAVEAVVRGADSAQIVRDRHQTWFRELFAPSVAIGLVGPDDLIRYRNQAVFLRGSRYVPMNWEAVPEAMERFFDLLVAEEEPAVRAVLGHFFFVFIHPYQDGNGRIARFLMNAMLAAGGYRWTVIRVDDRVTYMQALEAASLKQDIEPFAEFLARQVQQDHSEAA